LRIVHLYGSVTHFIMRFVCRCFFSAAPSR
jgi:hypothetical protein